MNKARHNKLQRLIEQLAAIKDQLETLQQAEQDAYDNASEKVQDDERGDAMLEAVGDIEAAVNSVDEAIDSCTQAQGALPQ